MESVLMTPRELGELLKLGRNKIYEIIGSGELPVIRFGRAIRIPRVAVLKWIDRVAGEGKSDPHGQLPESSMTVDEPAAVRRQR